MALPLTFERVAGRNVFAGTHVSEGSLNVNIARKTWSGDSGYSQRVPQGTTGLHLASRYGLTAAIKLMASILDADASDSYSRTPLSLAAENEHAEVVKMLLDTAQVEVDSKDNDGQTPLSWAAENGHAEVVKMLLDTAQVEVSSTDTAYGRTPLLWAAKAGSEHVLSILISVGADYYATDRFGLNPLHCTVFGNHKSAEDLLVAAGADLEDAYGLGFLFST